MIVRDRQKHSKKTQTDYKQDALIITRTHSGDRDIYTVSQKRPQFYFSNNSVKNEPILMIFGELNPEKIWHQQLVHLPTSPIYCSHFTLVNPKSHFSTVLSIHTSDYLRHLRRKQTVIPLPTTPENCHPTTQTQHFHLTEGMYVPPNFGGSGMSRWWVGIGGSEKNWLWCAANGMSGKQHYSKCSKWPHSAQIHASSLFRHWSTV